MDILPVFCDIDDFCQLFEPLWKQRLLCSGERQRDRAARLCLSEVMTIIVLFHASSYRNFKAYYTEHAMKHYAGAFPRLVSYQRFVELMPSALVPLVRLLADEERPLLGHLLHRLDLFEGLPQPAHPLAQGLRGVRPPRQNLVDWFFGFKLHLVINDCGELLSLRLTPGNTDDRRPVPELVKEPVRQTLR